MMRSDTRKRLEAEAQIAAEANSHAGELLRDSHGNPIRFVPTSLPEASRATAAEERETLVEWLWMQLSISGFEDPEPHPETARLADALLGSDWLANHNAGVRSGSPS